MFGLVDGNCMFRSFVDQLGYDADGPKDYKNARKAAVQYIRRNESTFEPFMEPGSNILIHYRPLYYVTLPWRIPQYLSIS